jgi:O-antigen/teichoic acid export membrane protein
VIDPVDRAPAPTGERHGQPTSAGDLLEAPAEDAEMAAQLALARASLTKDLIGPTPTAQPSGAKAALTSITRNSGFRDGAMLALRFVQARLLSVWGLLLAAALCPPKVFADFAIFAALVNVGSIAALLRFEMVFFQNSDRLRLGRAFRLAVVTGALFLSATLIAILFAASQGWILRGFGALFLISLASRAAIRLLLAEATAEGDFATIGNSNVVQALVQPGMMILLIWPLGPTALALFAADAFGHAVTAIYLAWRRRGALLRLMHPSRWSRAELIEAGWQWRSAPTYLLPSALLSFGFSAAPLMALPMSSSPMLAAHVALASRLLDMPAQMFGAVTVPLVMSDLRKHQGGDRQRRARLLTLGMAAIVAVLFTTIAFVAVGADELILSGTKWDGVGQVMAVMALFYGCGALVGPLQEMGTFSSRPHRQMTANAVALAAAVIVIWGIGSLSTTLLAAIGLISLARLLLHLRLTWTGIGDAQPIGARA